MKVFGSELIGTSVYHITLIRAYSKLLNTISKYATALEKLPQMLYSQFAPHCKGSSESMAPLLKSKKAYVVF